MFDPTSYDGAHEILQRNGKSVPTRKIANNTYLQRRPGCCGIPHDLPACVAVMFHETDIVTFHAKWVPTITLNAGGWYTMSTSERINRYLPEPLRLMSQRGRWMVLLRIDHGVPVTRPFFDGMTLRFNTDGPRMWLIEHASLDIEVQAQNAHNARMDKLIDDYLKPFQPVEDNDPIRSLVPDGPACGMCVRTDVGRLIGDEFKDKQHLIDHLIDKEVPYSVWWVASEHVCGSNLRLNHRELAVRDLRKYLRQQLYVGAVAIKNGKRPAHAEPWRMNV